MKKMFFVSALAVLTAAGMFSVYAAEADKTAIKDGHKEPNLKVTKESGGKSTSYLVKDAPLTKDRVLGKATAPILIIEYASLSCPHCAHFSTAVMPELQKNYIDTGRVKFILRQFPLNEPALKGAMLLDCIGDQSSDQYYVFAHVLFDAQSKWAFDGNYMAGLETIASVGGLSKQQFSSCVNSTEREMKVLEEKDTATKELAVPHTPYFFIDGQVYGGPPTFEGMSKFIDDRVELRKK